MTDHEPLLVVENATDAIRVFTLNRPEARNAINDALAQELGAALAEFDEDESARVGILTGAGGGLCAGLDLKAFLAGELGETADGGFAGFVKHPPAKPLIAAVEGFALAGGFELLLACDLIVVASDARLAIPEVRRGLVADGGALLRLPRRLPFNIAMELAVTGRDIPADRLARLGLVNIVAEPGRALPAAIALASEVAANAPLGVSASKRILRQSASWHPDEQWERQYEIAQPVWTSDDANEGARAFAEKRAPHFTGR